MGVGGLASFPNPKMPAGLYLLTALAAHDGPEAHPCPQLVPLMQEVCHLMMPIFAQGPGKNYTFGFLQVLLHVICKVPGHRSGDGGGEQRL